VPKAPQPDPGSGPFRSGRPNRPAAGQRAGGSAANRWPTERRGVQAVTEEPPQAARLVRGYPMAWLPETPPSGIGKRSLCSPKPPPPPNLKRWVPASPRATNPPNPSS
jgi:hypothetical protein